jgi:hypothetical protein
VAAVIGRAVKILAHVIGREERRAARPAMDVCGLDRPPQIVDRRHVADGVVNEDAVEQARQADRAHVAFDVLALRVERAAHLQHAGRPIDQHHREPRFQVRGVVAAAAAQLEQRARRAVARRDQLLLVEARFLDVVGRIRQQRPPRRELVIEPRLGAVARSAHDYCDDSAARFQRAIIASRSNFAPSR